MSERDWGGELSEAVGNDSPRSPQPPPPAPTDNWVDELAASIGEDRLAPFTPAAEHHDGAGDPATLRDVDGRLARVEALLSADLDKLGPAVLHLAASHLETRLSALAERIDGIGEEGGAGVRAVLNQLDRMHDDNLRSFVAFGDRFDDLSQALRRLDERLRAVEATLDGDILGDDLSPASPAAAVEQDPPPVPPTPPVPPLA